jgi:hypothetical protein
VLRGTLNPQWFCGIGFGDISSYTWHSARLEYEKEVFNKTLNQRIGRILAAPNTTNINAPGTTTGVGKVKTGGMWVPMVSWKD